MSQESAQAGFRRNALVALAALGVVFGDIGTSPLYALKECFADRGRFPVTPDNVLGIVSLIVWSLILLISIEYNGLILRADNKGEGGILALGTLVSHSLSPKRPPWVHSLVTIMMIFGAALLYGDGAITPTISVLSALEGLKVATPAFDDFVVPLTVAILVGLFSLQRFGTGRIGILFGPVMVVWFTVLGLLGISGIVAYPAVLEALNPVYAVRFIMAHGLDSFLVLGAVFLAVTGGEALYADMGHFGRRAIRTAWFCCALPGLLLNYFGQAALLLKDPHGISNPFFEIVPQWGLLPMVGLATMASVIASQALISGVFSLTRQAMRLGFSPRLTMIHTSAHAIGQIYVPVINWLLLITAIWLALTFQSSTALAGAYGVAVSLTMLVTMSLAVAVARTRWQWNSWVVAVVFTPFLVIILAFFVANSLKIPHGGWIPLVMALAVFVVMTTWRRGRELLSERLRQHAVSLQEFLARLSSRSAIRVNGTAVFMTGNPESAPFALINNLNHNRVLHERVVFVAFVPTEEPHIPLSEGVSIEVLGQGFYRIRVRTGFMDTATVPDCFAECRQRGFDIDENHCTFFLGREIILAADERRMPEWRRGLFTALARNALNPAPYFDIPPDRVIEIGMQVEI